MNQVVGLKKMFVGVIPQGVALAGAPGWYEVGRWPVGDVEGNRMGLQEVERFEPDWPPGSEPDWSPGADLLGGF